LVERIDRNTDLVECLAGTVEVIAGPAAVEFNDDPQ
jgi:hypothetical protein